MGAVTQYARTADGTHIAYSVTGDGPIDVLVCTEWTFNLDLASEHPALMRLAERLGRGARVISMNRRGIGASDPVPVADMAILESWVEDVVAVLDRVGSARTAIVGVGHGGHVAMVFAATRPERVSHLVLVDAYARAATGPDYPYGFAEEDLEDYANTVERSWGKRTGGATFDPQVWSEPDFPHQLARLQRLTASPREAASIQRVVNALDVRPVLELIGAPTLVVFLDNAATGRDNARYVAEHIAGARYIELPGYHYFTSVADTDRLADAVLEFTTGDAPAPDQDRVLATVLFTDIVGSTEAAVEVGDHPWSALLDRHDGAVRRQLQRFDGREINTTGDGFVAVFEGPARAIRCADAIHDAVRPVGLAVKIGLHCGEIELRGDDVSGITVNLAQRICSHASPGEVLVSRTIVDLVAGSDLVFEDRGMHDLKGISEPRRLWAVRNAA